MTLYGIMLKSRGIDMSKFIRIHDVVYDVEEYNRFSIVKKAGSSAVHGFRAGIHTPCELYYGSHESCELLFNNLVSCIGAVDGFANPEAPAKPLKPSARIIGQNCYH